MFYVVIYMAVKMEMVTLEATTHIVMFGDGSRMNDDIFL